MKTAQFLLIVITLIWRPQFQTMLISRVSSIQLRQPLSRKPIITKNSITRSVDIIIGQITLPMNCIIKRTTQLISIWTTVPMELAIQMPRFPLGWNQSEIRWGDIAKSLKSSDLFFLIFSSKPKTTQICPSSWTTAWRSWRRSTQECGQWSRAATSCTRRMQEPPPTARWTNSSAQNFNRWCRTLISGNTETPSKPIRMPSSSAWVETKNLRMIWFVILIFIFARLIGVLLCYVSSQ